ncbi:hypothetical protein [Bradymonas sediminis]|uniref:hypothetical protein n=1 Tax=Bradymonas sediminis TaxID=1548548 RepID=UPI0010D6FD93|nr:hypothetical protein [Bradymonas sediminis]TDP76635.1 TM2 domain-containing membrane protein YozV [Bradymonas sediminis]
MHRPDQLNRSIVSLYRAQGDLPLSPSFVAYELDIPTADAEASLDDLVRESILEFDFDQDGEIFYRPGSAYPFEGRTTEQPSTDWVAQATGWDAVPGAADGQAGAPNSDGAADGYAGSPAPRAPQGPRRAAAQQYDGYAGTAVATRNRAAAPQTRPSTSRPRPRATSSAREYIPPRSARHTSRSSRRGRGDYRASHRRNAAEYAPSHQGYAAAPQQRWAEIGPNGCDGSVTALQDTAAPRHSPRPAQSSAAQPGRPPSAYRGHAAPRPHSSTALVPASADPNLPARSRHRGDPLLASFLSLLFVGSGQFYNGEFGKGIAFFISFIVLWAFALGWIVHIWAAVDAYQVATLRKEQS